MDSWSKSLSMQSASRAAASKPMYVIRYYHGTVYIICGWGDGGHFTPTAVNDCLWLVPGTYEDEQ